MDDIKWEEININDGLEKIYCATINDTEISIKKDFGEGWKISFDKINSKDNPKIIKFPKKIFLQKGLRSDDEIIKYLKEESVKINKKYGRSEMEKI